MVTLQSVGKKMTAKNNVKEAIVSYAIERALIDYGNSALEEVYYRLYREYGIHFVDCLHNPDYLRKTLLDVFGDSFIQIVELIKGRLGEFSVQPDVKSFLTKLK